MNLSLALLRLDPAFRGLTRWAVVAMLGASSFTAIAAATAQQDVALSWRPIVACLWGGIAFFLVVAPAYGSNTSFTLALPLNARQLWLTHTLGRFIGVSILLVGSATVSTALISLIPEPGVTGATVWLWAVHVGAAAFLGLSIWAFWAPPAGFSGRHTGRGLVAGFLVAVAILALSYALDKTPTALLALPVFLGLGLLVARYRSLCGALTLVSSLKTGMSPTKAITTAYAPARGPWSQRWLLLGTLLSTLYRHPAVFFLVIPANAVFGFILAGPPSEWPEGGEARFSYTLMTAYIMLSMSGIALARLGQVDHLPVSRRLLTACMIGPVAAAMVLGYAVGEWGVSRMGSPELVKCRDDQGHVEIYVPLSAQRIAWDGRLPDNTSPAGETHSPWSMRLLQGTDAVFYNPYYIPEDASADFAAWQLSRALHAVYNRYIEPDELKARYLEETTDGALRLAAAGFAPRRDYPDLEPVDSGPVFPFAMLGTGLIYLGVFALLLYGFNRNLKRRWQQAYYWIILGSMMVFYIGQIAGQSTGYYENWALDGAILILIADLGRLPGGTAAAWACSFLVLAAAYLGVEALLRRSETHRLYIAGESSC